MNRLRRWRLLCCSMASICIFASLWHWLTGNGPTPWSEAPMSRTTWGPSGADG
jgi:hypothetical protein